MLNIISDIVSISKLESGQMETVISDTNINEKLEFVHGFLKPEADQKGIGRFAWHPLPTAEAFIKTDREKISSILMNLVKNAIKFSPKGSIDFGCDLVETDNYPSVNTENYPSLRFYVRDTGVGIPENQKEFIFERFRQGSDFLTRNYEGAGLGLAISKAYVEMLGGKIWEESEYGKGSTFYFTIPCDASKAKQLL
jgi:signal transduction histidine kinase